MYEVERMCDEIIMIKEGKIAATGTPADLLAHYKRKNLEEVFLDIARA
jgi:ABC-2 type transport system ATP-binding protein